MKKILLISLCLFSFFITPVAQAQNIQVDIVQNEHGIPEAPASAADLGSSFSYDTIRQVMTIMKEYVIDALYGNLAQAFTPIWRGLILIFFAAYFISWQFGRPLMELDKFLFAVIFIAIMNTIIFTDGVFEEWIYNPIVKTSIGLASHIIQWSDMSSNTTNVNLESTLILLEEKIGSVSALTGRINEVYARNSGWIEGKMVGLAGMIKAFFVDFLFFMLIAVFVILFLLGYIGMHIMLAVAPVALMLAAVPYTRGIAKNWLRETCTYALIPTFAAIAMGATIFILSDIAIQIDQFINNPALNDVAPPDGLYWKVALVGVFSIFFHIKASTFAAGITGGAGSSFGSFFATGLSMGIATYKTGVVGKAAGLTTRGTIGAGKGLGKAAKGLGNWISNR